MQRFIAAATLVLSGYVVTAGAQGREGTSDDATASTSPTFVSQFGYTRSTVPLDAAYAINRAGDIAGKLGNDAAVYSQGNIILLPGKPGYTALEARDIADNGYIVGSGLSAGSRRPLFWSSTTSPPRDMGAFGPVTVPTSVNSQGVAVGYYFFPGPDDGPRAFRWSPATAITDISPPDTRISEALDISETGYVAGFAAYSSLLTYAFRWYPDGSAGRIAPVYANRALNNGSVFGGSALWDLNNALTLIGPDPNTHFVNQMSAAGRLVGHTATSVEAPLARAWTTFNNGAALYLPTPARAASVASDVSGCGTILGAVTLADGTIQYVTWSKLTCDRVRPVVTQQ